MSADFAAKSQHLRCTNLIDPEPLIRCGEERRQHRGAGVPVVETITTNDGQTLIAQTRLDVATTFLTNGTASFTDPAYFSGPLSGAVSIDSTDITVRAAKPGSSGSGGVVVTWAGHVGAYPGDCPLPPPSGRRS
jgi:hypothetical protein